MAGETFLHSVQWPIVCIGETLHLSGFIASGTSIMLKTLPHVYANGAIDQSFRTEDVKFSPSGRILAVVATNGTIFLFAVDTRSRPIEITRCAVVNSTSLSSPHGVDFLREDLIVVANRSAWVTFYRIPSVDEWQDHINVEPIHEMASKWFGPKSSTRLLEERAVSVGAGSIRVHGKELFVSCNNSGTVTAHPYRLRHGTLETGEGTIITAGLEIPDGVALTRDGRWIAVSDHHKHRVLVYRRKSKTQSCVLSDPDLRFPHGLCFDPTGRLLYVADAGQRNIHVFAAMEGWDKPMDGSAGKRPAVKLAAFSKTKEATPEGVRDLEGGVKGIDVDPSGHVIATTCRHQTLRFFKAKIKFADEHRPRANLPRNVFGTAQAFISRVFSQE
jgi:WD40 repeat protein